jgi:transposase
MTQKADVISLKNQGKSNRAVARELGLNRETVSKYWEEYKRQLHELSKADVDTKEIQEKLVSKPTYPGNRKPYKYTEKLEERLKEILKSEARKDVLLGVGHKQNMTNKQIHELILNEGYDVGSIAICIIIV